MYLSIIYISLAESFVGNLRDIFIYALARRQLNNTYIHKTQQRQAFKLIAAPIKALIPVIITAI